jgi:hypothetical protein
MRLILLILLLLSVASASAYEFTGIIGGGGVLGTGITGRIGVTSGGGGGGCASPTAPDGVIDLSECSNAWYVAVVF